METLRSWQTRLPRFIQILTLLLALASGSVRANPAIPTNSYDAHIRNLLLSGKVAEALNYARQHYSRVPDFLNKYAEAFKVDNQKVGQCQDVARAIYTALSRLGTKAEYIAIRVKWDHPLFKLKDGTEKTISFNGNHYAVRVEGVVYDAFTGPEGMKVEEYLSRIILPEGIKITKDAIEVVSSL